MLSASSIADYCQFLCKAGTRIRNYIEGRANMMPEIRGDEKCAGALVLQNYMLPIGGQMQVMPQYITNNANMMLLWGILVRAKKPAEGGVTYMSKMVQF